MTDTHTLPSLSVIIPVYNVKAYVEEAVDSILHQSAPATEVIIVNDGSTDGSGDLVERRYGQHPRVTVVHTANGGLGEARNVGTRAARGEFIYYFDSDDVAVEGLIATFQRAWQQQPDLDIFAFSADSFHDPQGAAVGESRHKLMSYRRGLTQTFASGEEAFNAFFRRGAFIPNAWLYVFRRRVQAEHQLWFLPIIHEDEEFTPRLFFRAGKVVVSDTVFFRRRVRAGSIMQSGRGEKNAIGYLRACEALEQLQSGCRRRDSRAALRARLIENLVLVMTLRKRATAPFSAQTEADLANLMRRHRCPELLLARRNLLGWRLMNFARKRLRKRRFA
ncbi:glycosyltransferase [Pantoea sp. 1.19]|uniref:glycosyltransferase family 2 protein n=1 Tax=Pantoea sp. 1.19 TaxID=1925589 RepID=UPI0009490F37|nr:glycosyltransferase [Pantoea sp. 1.19]